MTKRSQLRGRSTLLAAALLGITTPLSGNGPESLTEVDAASSSLRFDQLQYIGTHNSYHLAPWPEVADEALRFGYAESADWPATRLFAALDYTHPDLSTQLEMGLRQFEIDVHYDPLGGKFRDQGHIEALRRLAPQRMAQFDPDDRLAQPGFKVFHGGLDMRSHCLLLRDCLTTLRQWSEAHPRHFPIILHFEVKDGTKPALDESYTPTTEEPFEVEQWTALEQEIIDVLGPETIVTPTEVTGGHRNLSSTIRRDGWPTLDHMAGRFVLLLLNKKEETNSYLDASGHLTHKLFFTSRALGDRNASWFRMPDPEYPALRPQIRRGFLATVQADTHTYEARTGRTERRESALSSGAQFILTDYPTADSRFTPYQVRFENGRYVRCNPVRVKGACPIR
jgi:hypothetical protein